jgi:hypothetical protein
VEERRKQPRARVLKTGRIAVGAKAPKIECAIRSISPEGACLQIPSGTFGIPHAFDLVLDATTRHACHVVWRTETKMGVAFG